MEAAQGAAPWLPPLSLQRGKTPSDRHRATNARPLVSGEPRNLSKVKWASMSAAPWGGGAPPGIRHGGPRRSFDFVRLRISLYPWGDAPPPGRVWVGSS